MLGKLVTSQFERANIVLALVFFALPFILQIFFWLVFGIAADFSALIVRTILPSLFAWIVSAAALYILLLGFKGKSARGTFKSILSTLPVFSLAYFIGFLLMSVIFFIGVPAFFQSRPLAPSDVAAISYIIASNPQPIHWVVLIIGMLIGLALIASYFYITMKIAKMVKETGTFSDCVLAVAFAAISFAIYAAFTLVFSGI